MTKKPGVSAIEAELQGGSLVDEGYRRPRAVPRPKATQKPTMPRAEKPNNILPPPSIEIVTPVDSQETTSERLDQVMPGGKKCIGTIKNLCKSGNTLHVDGVLEAVVFGSQACKGLYKALRIGDRVDCIVHKDDQGYYAYRVTRVYS